MKNVILIYQLEYSFLFNYSLTDGIERGLSSTTITASLPLPTEWLCTGRKLWRKI